MNLREQRILVAGLGASGEAATRLALAGGAAVVAVDSADTPALRARADALRALGAEVRLGGWDWPGGRLDRAIFSPGIPSDSPWHGEARRRGIALQSELEFGWSWRAGRAAAVTGSNGKSTAVRLLTDCLAAGGFRTAAAGNIGTPACEAVAEGRGTDWLVLEVSSFQLETCFALRPDVGLLLNVQPNHLDRHPDFETYRNLKFSLFARQEPPDLALLPSGLAEAVRAACPGARGRVRTFGGPGDPPAEVRYEPGRILGAGPGSLSLRGTSFDNEVLGPGAAAVAAAALACGADAGAVESALRDFRPLPHRMQTVGERAGVRYVDNSKATTLAAMMASLRMIPGPVRLIAGGLPKETDWSAAGPLLETRVRGVYLIGQAAGSMAEAWSGKAPCFCCGTVEAAVARAAAEASPGETVLLAPACASFDQFRSYAERGERFARAVAAGCGAGGAVEKED